MRTLPMANSCIAAVRAHGKVARTPLPSPIPKPAARRSCMPLKNAAACVASLAPSGSRAPPCPVGSKKVAQLPPLRHTLLAPDPEDPTSTILELDELWSFVLKKAHDSWIWIALCRKTRQVVAYAVGDRSRQDVSMLVGGHSRQLSYWSLLHGFLGNVSGGHPGGAAHSCGRRD